MNTLTRETLATGSDSGAAQAIDYIGNPEILSSNKLALFCSRKCPGAIIVETYHYAHILRSKNRTIISGFQTPMEKECLRVFLNGPQKLIICPARGLENIRIRPEWRKGLKTGRLLIVSPFPKEIRRATAQLSLERNRFVAELADEICVPYAAEGSKTAEFLKLIEKSGKEVFNLSAQSYPSDQAPYPEFPRRGDPSPK